MKIELFQPTYNKLYYADNSAGLDFSYFLRKNRDTYRENVFEIIWFVLCTQKIFEKVLLILILIGNKITVCIHP